jgi:3-hydroxy-3-methylglutaryl CoA synthase
VSAICDLSKEITAVDFSRSTRAGASALKAGLDAVAAGSDKGVIVVAADCRLGEPGSDQELILGDGSAAMMVGNKNVLAGLSGHYAISSDFTDFLRLDGESSVRRMDDLRFINQFGYKKAMSQCISGLLKKYKLQPKDVSKVICPSPEPTTLFGLAKSLGFDPKRQLQDPFFDKIGHIGTGHPLLMLAAALDKAEEGDKILMAAYGDGAEAFLFAVTKDIKRIKGNGTIKKMVSGGRMYDNYQRYLAVRNSFVKADRPLRPYTSPALDQREEKQNVRRYGNRCRECGFVQYPMRRICLDCGVKDSMEDVRISDRGEIFTFTREHYIPFQPLNPPMAMVVVDMEGGGRLHIQMTDHEYDEVFIGNKVRLTYRRLFEAGDVTNYFWKCIPIRNGAA